MVKPYYAGIVIAAACLLALKRRDIRAFFMPEFLFSGAITAAYLGLSYALYPAFFETLLPLLRDTYMAFRQPADILLLAASPWLALPVAYALLRRLIDRPEPSDFLMLAAAIALLPYFLAGQGLGLPHLSCHPLRLGGAGGEPCHAVRGAQFQTP